MAQFSEADINAAKRRVLDMRNRASQYTGENTVHDINFENKSEKQNKKNEEKIFEEKSNNENNADADTEQDKSLFIILALILILSREGADHKLILALLYLLL